MGRTVLSALVVALGVTVAGAEQGRWVNVHVAQHRDDTRVELHLPVNLVLTVLDSVKAEGLRHGKVHLGVRSSEVDWVAILRGVREAPEGDYVRVSERDAEVLVRKRAGVVTVEVNERGDRGERVLVTLPEPLLDAFVVDEDDRLDLRAFLAALGRSPAGDVLQIESADANVRIWVE
jgi:hypothetical protein